MDPIVERNESIQSRSHSIRRWFIQRFLTKSRENIYSHLERGKMESLPFQNLSEKLKKLVLNFLDIEETIRLLKVNKEIRKLICLKGPFSRNLEQLKFSFVGSTKESLTRLSKIPMEICSDRNFVNFYFTKFFENLEETIPLKNLLDNVEFCRSVRFEFPKATRIFAENLRIHFESLKFLENLKQISDFYLTSEYIAFVKVIMENFKPKILDSFVLNFYWKKDQNQEVHEYFSTENLHLQDSNWFRLNEQDEFCWEIFCRINQEIVCSNPWENRILHRSLRIFLQNGNSLTNSLIPASGIHSINWVLKIIPDNNWGHLAEGIFQNFAEILVTTKGIELVDDNSAEAKSIFGLKGKFEKVIKEPLYFRFDTFENDFKAFFKRKISVNKECIFMANVMDKRDLGCLGYIDIRLSMKFVPTLALP